MPSPYDPSTMDCESIQTALSARADGELAGVADSVVDRHVRTCADCAAFAGVIGEIAPAGSAVAHRVDVSGRVVAVAGRVDRARVWWGIRAALFAIAVGELVQSIPDLMSRASEAAGDIHMQRHLGAFQISYAVGLLVVALRPAKARALVPLTAALAAAMIGASIFDISQGVAPALGEAQHALEISGLVLVWLLATRRGWPGRTHRSARSDVAAPTSAPADRPRLVDIEGDESSGLLGRHSA